MKQSCIWMNLFLCVADVLRHSFQMCVWNSHLTRRLCVCVSSLVSGDPKTWQNKSLPGDPNYLVGANCVSVLIDHFWRGQQLACYWMWETEDLGCPCPAPFTEAGALCYMKSELGTLTLFTVSKIIEEHTRVRKGSLKISASPRLHSFLFFSFFLSFFGALKACKKKKRRSKQVF